MIADNSSVYKKMYTKAVAELDEGAAVTFVASGEEALERTKRFDYDIVVIDTEMAEPYAARLMESIARNILGAFLLVTARPSPGNAERFAEALAKGAADCMTKPIYSSYNENLDTIKEKMENIYKALCAARDKKGRSTEGEVIKRKRAGKHDCFPPEVVLVAASTGGPLALEKIFSELREDFPVPILAIQHMPPYFMPSLAQHLNQKSRLRVKVAERDETAVAGTVYIAPGGVHMKLDAKNKIHFDGSPPLNGVRPAADVLFESVAESFSGSRVLAVVLTGMGCDGEKGLAALKEKRNCVCLAQSEGTCVVYGMPRAVVESGFADKVLDLEEIPAEIERFCFPLTGRAGGDGKAREKS